MKSYPVISHKENKVHIDLDKNGHVLIAIVVDKNYIDMDEFYRGARCYEDCAKILPNFKAVADKINSTIIEFIDKQEGEYKREDFSKIDFPDEFNNYLPAISCW